MKSQDQDNIRLSHAVRDTHFRIRQFLRDYATESLEPHMSWVEVLVLSYIYDHQDKKCRAKDVVDHTTLSKASVSQALTLLQGKGMIQVSIYKKDRRVKYLALEEEGKTLVERFRETFDQMVASLEQGITKEEKEITLRVLALLRENCLALCANSSKKKEKEGI